MAKRRLTRAPQSISGRSKHKNIIEQYRNYAGIHLNSYLEETKIKLRPSDFSKSQGDDEEDDET